MFNVLEAKKGKNILEVGCGTGLGIVTAFNYLDKNSSYTGTDLSENMIEYSLNNVKKITGQNLPNLQVFQADNENLDKLQSSAYDRYIANLSL